MLPNYTEFDLEKLSATVIYGDNQSALCTANAPVDSSSSSRFKHIDIRFHVTCEALADGRIRLEYICTDDMTADLLTKALPRDKHEKHVKGIGFTEEKA